MTATLAVTQTALLAQGLSDALADCLDWAPALRRLDDHEVGLHLAIMTGPFLHLILTGTKTVESRFSRVRCAPWQAVAPGDLVALKPSGRPVTAVFAAGDVHYLDLASTPIADVRRDWAEPIGAVDDGFWDTRADARYATLVEVAAIAAIAAIAHRPVDVPKRDRRGWIALTQAHTPEQLP